MSPRDAEVDVLIIGAGAAGMMMATSCAAYGVKTRIIDKRPNKPRVGHGDGTQARLMEIMDSFGLAKTLIAKGNPFVQTHSWMQNDEGKLVRVSARYSPWDPPSPFTTVSLTQNRVADIMLDYCRQHSDISVERSTMPESIKVDSSESEYPVSVKIQHDVAINGFVGDRNDDDIKVDDDAAILEQTAREKSSLEAETIKAKYVVACDGSHSWTRRQLDIPMIGDDTDLIFGVCDIVPVTDFPSLRVTNLLGAKNAGLMWIPRERNMIRIYTVMGAAKTDSDGKLVRSTVTLESILDAARKIMHPYKLDYLSCEWFAGYQIGQRCATSNVDESGRIFLAGDAVHTHSPQAGQGMNVSMADTYNLGWKLALVTKGLASPALLKTYSEERLILGQRLVDFDRQFAALIAGRAPPDAPQDVASVQIEREKLGLASALIFHGLQVQYLPGLLTRGSMDAVKAAQPFLDNGKLPPGIVTGMRMPSFHVRRHASGFLTLLGESFKSNGAFKLVIFPGDISKPAHMQCYIRLADNIAALQRKYTPEGHKSDSVIDALTLHTADPLSIAILDLPEVFHPFDPKNGWDYDKVYCDETDIYDTAAELHYGSAYKKYDIDPNIGRLVLLRPDGYVAYQGDVGAFDPIKEYFAAFMIPQTQKAS